MKIPRATDATAIAAGAWAGLVSIAYLAMVASVKTLEQQQLFLVAGALVLFPTLPFVVGLDALMPETRKGWLIGNIHYVPRIMRRGLLWLAGAGAIGLPGSVVFNYVAGAT